MSILANIENADMQYGETRNGTCPQCGQRKFYVTRKPGGFAFICFRASCGYKGFQGCAALTDERVDIDYSVRRGRKGNAYTGELFLVDYRDMDWFEVRFGVYLGDDPKGCAYWCKVTDDGRYAFPMWGPRDEYRGIVLRRPLWDGDPEPLRTDTKNPDCPKAISYFEENVKARLAWYHSTQEGICVIVEDQVSAMRIASLGFTSVAILGTNFYPEFVSDFIKWQNGECDYVLALDPDAFTKSLKIAGKWGPTFKRPLRVARLKCDAKDYHTDKELLEDLGI